MYLFLDFDGVLHPHASVETGDDRYFKTDNCMAVADLLERNPDINVVISSTWRHLHDLETIKKMLPDEISNKIIDITPTIAYSYTSGMPEGHREVEIQQWLYENAPDAKWCALDDKPEFFYNFSSVYLVHEQQGFLNKDIASIEKQLDIRRKTTTKELQQERETVIKKHQPYFRFLPNKPFKDFKPS